MMLYVILLGYYFRQVVDLPRKKRPTLRSTDEPEPSGLPVQQQRDEAYCLLGWRCWRGAREEREAEGGIRGEVAVGERARGRGWWVKSQ